jgi:hypothetical protein
VQHILHNDYQRHDDEINQRDCEGETGLHWAARSGRRDVVALLLSHQNIDTTPEGAQGTAAEVLSISPSSAIPVDDRELNACMVEQVARRSGFYDIARMIEYKELAAENQLLAELPWEVILHVLSFLEPYDLCTVSQVCVVRSLDFICRCTPLSLFADPSRRLRDDHVRRDWQNSAVRTLCGAAFARPTLRAAAATLL